MRFSRLYRISPEQDLTTEAECHTRARRDPISLGWLVLVEENLRRTPREGTHVQAFVETT
jgi:hypothetical protein